MSDKKVDPESTCMRVLIAPDAGAVFFGCRACGLIERVTIGDKLATTVVREHAPEFNRAHLHQDDARVAGMYRASAQMGSARETLVCAQGAGRWLRGVNGDVYIGKMPHTAVALIRIGEDWNAYGTITDTDMMGDIHDGIEARGAKTEGVLALALFAEAAKRLATIDVDDPIWRHAPAPLDNPRNLEVLMQVQEWAAEIQDWAETATDDETED